MTPEKEETPKCETCNGDGTEAHPFPLNAPCPTCKACGGTGKKPLPEAPRCGGSGLADWLRNDAAAVAALDIGLPVEDYTGIKVDEIKTISREEVQRLVESDRAANLPEVKSFLAALVAASPDCQPGCGEAIRDQQWFDALTHIEVVREVDSITGRFGSHTQRALRAGAEVARRVINEGHIPDCKQPEAGSVDGEEALAKAERHCEEAIDDVVRAEKLIERRIKIEAEDGTPFGKRFCEEILAELRATDAPEQSHTEEGSPDA